MRKLLLCFALLAAVSLNAQEAKRTILLTGASFASPENGWFELGCAKVGATPLNRAIGGEAIADTANAMAEGKLYSKAELEDLDALVVMQVHNRDVASPEGLKDKYTDYTTPFDRSNYAAAYDYVIKRYISDCYELRNDKNSKYYGTKMGKPAVILLCTDWHDARVTYNMSVRKLADRWGLPVVEFDNNIGFSKNTPHPVTDEQYSLIYSNDTQKIDGVTFGWHPERGQDKYIQQRMGAIFADRLQQVIY